jgi:hypothetical protein
MTLNQKIQVELPEKGVTVRRLGIRQTVYKVIRCYRNETGQPTNDRVEIGKLDPVTGKLIPNNRYWEFYPQVSKELEVMPICKSDRAVGGSILVYQIMDCLGLCKILVECLGYERADLVKTACDYMAAR